MAPPLGAASRVGSTASSQAFFGEAGTGRPGEKGGMLDEDIGQRLRFGLDVLTNSNRRSARTSFLFREAF